MRLPYRMVYRCWTIPYIDSIDMTKLDDWTTAYLRESRKRLEEGVPIVTDLY